MLLPGIIFWRDCEILAKNLIEIGEMIGKSHQLKLSEQFFLIFRGQNNPCTSNRHIGPSETGVYTKNVKLFRIIVRQVMMRLKSKMKKQLQYWVCIILTLKI